MEDTDQLHERAASSLIMIPRASVYQLTKRNIPVPCENQPTVLVSNYFADKLGFCKDSGLNKFLLWGIFSAILEVFLKSL
jgi:hypothetical protein